MSQSSDFANINVGEDSVQKDDYKPLWRFVTKGEKEAKGGGNVPFSCNYCGNDYKGTYSRVRAHLLKLKGFGIGVCSKVSNKDLVDMKKLEDDACERKLASMPKKIPLPPCADASKIGSSSSTSSSLHSFRVGSLGVGTKRRKGVEESALEKAYRNQERDELRAHIARMFYSGGLPFHLARNPYYVSSFTYACNHNLAGFIPPGYNLLRNSLLQQEMAHIERMLQPIKTTWKEKGVTIVCDGWSDPQRRPLINFMAVTESGPMFIKAINCEGEYKDKEFIANAIISVIREVGVENVVQVITDNAPVCKAAGVLIEVEYPHIFWTPCVVHTLNLALKSICNVKNKEGNEVAFDELGWIREVADDALMIKNFIMNHNMRLAIFNEFVPLKLLAIADTRFASIIIMLKRFKLVKNGLQLMVISDKWNLYREDDVGKAQFVKDKILNDVWWDKVDFILTFTSPIYDMLRMGDTDKPSLHKIYEGWDSMIEQVKKAIFRYEGKLDSEESTFFNVVYDILVQRWTKSNTPLHCLAHSLTPRYYSQSWLNEAPNRVPPHKDGEITRERMKCLKRIFQDPDDLRNVYVEYAKFSNCYEDFGDMDCMNQRGDMEPHFWWAIHGHSTPLLQSLALKLVGQPSSSSCCERNWSTYSFIHSFRRNKLTPKRAQDLVFVHNNLRLLSRKSPQYMQGNTKMWDIGGDCSDDVVEDIGVLSVASLSLDEPELEKVFFTDEGDENIGDDQKIIEEEE